MTEGDPCSTVDLNMRCEILALDLDHQPWVLCPHSVPILGISAYLHFPRFSAEYSVVN